MAFFGNLFGSGKTFSDRMRYVDDFKTEEYRDARGKVRSRAIYIGVWTVLEKPGKKTLSTLIGAAALAALSAAVLLYALLQPNLFGGELLVMIPLCVALFPSMYALMGAFSLPYRQKPMRRDQFMHSITRMQRSTVAILAFLAVGIIVSFVLRLIRGDWLFLSGDWRFLIGLSMSVLCNCGVLALLGSIDTVERPNDAYRA